MTASTSTCHLNKPHYALGLCRSCYEKGLRVRNPHFAERQRENCRGWSIKHKEKKRRIDRAYSRANPRTRAEYLQRKYGITMKQYEQILASQNGVCAICARKPAKRPLAVDHDHKTNRIRGLLCFRCNYGLSWFQDQADRFLAAAKYLGGI